MTLTTIDDMISGTVSPASSVSELAGDEHGTMLDEAAAAEHVVHHKKYYLEDTHVALCASGAVFRVHSHFFTRESDEARSVVAQALAAKDDIARLEDVTAEGLERFCDVLYHGYASPSAPLTRKEEWASVLHLAHLWNFADIRALAIAKLSTSTSPVDRIVLGHRYHVHDWLEPAYWAVCEREEWLSDADGHSLGIDDVLKIARARQALRAAVPKPARDESNAALVRQMFFGVGVATTNELPSIPLLSSRDEADVPAPMPGSVESHMVAMPNSLLQSAAAPPPLQKEAETANSQSSSADRNVSRVSSVMRDLSIPASVLPAGFVATTLRSLSPPVYDDVQRAVAQVKAAQFKAEHAISVLQPLTEVAKNEKAGGQCAMLTTMTKTKKALTCERIANSERCIALYTEQIKKVQLQVKEAQAQLASLVSHASASGM